MKSLRWLANMFPFNEHPKDESDKMCNCINLYCTAAADKLEEYFLKGSSFYLVRCEGCINESTEECLHCMRAFSDCYEKR